MNTNKAQDPAPAVATDIDRVIHEPARLAIVSILAVVDSADFTFLLHQTGLTGGNLGAHLKKLEESGYIDVKKEFVDRIPHTILKLTDKGREAFMQYRERIESVINQSPIKL